MVDLSELSHKLNIYNLNFKSGILGKYVQDKK